MLETPFIYAVRNFFPYILNASIFLPLTKTLDTSISKLNATTNIFKDLISDMAKNRSRIWNHNGCWEIYLFDIINDEVQSVFMKKPKYSFLLRRISINLQAIQYLNSKRIYSVDFQHVSYISTFCLQINMMVHCNSIEVSIMESVKRREREKNIHANQALNSVGRRMKRNVLVQ